MSVEVFEPSETPTQTAPDGLGIVLFNHVGSTVSQDTGRDAQDITNRYGLPVIAVDRPGSACPPDRTLAQALGNPRVYLLHMDILGKEIDRRADSLGVHSLIAVGRSAGAVAALALARTEVVGSLRYIAAAEPVACEPMSVKDGLRRYRQYHLDQRQLIIEARRNDSDLIRPQSPSLPIGEAAMRIASLVPAAYRDRYNNKFHWSSDAAAQYAEYLAEHSDVDTTIEFATHSLAGNFAVVSYLRDVGASYRQPADVPFVVGRSPVETVHASYDNRDYMNGTFLGRIVARAAVDPYGG